MNVTSVGVPFHSENERRVIRLIDERGIGHRLADRRARPPPSATSESVGSGAVPVCVIATSFAPESPTSSVAVISSPGVRALQQRRRRHREASSSSPGMQPGDVAVLDGELLPLWM